MLGQLKIRLSSPAYSNKNGIAQRWAQLHYQSLPGGKTWIDGKRTKGRVKKSTEFSLIMTASGKTIITESVELGRRNHVNRPCLR